MTLRYYLLRNSIELGPYLLDELLQQNLRTDDLVWIEGQSALWVNPMEVSELKSHVKTPFEEMEGRDGASVFGDSYLSSAQEMERKAEQLRRRAMAALHHKVTILQSEPVTTSSENPKAPLPQEEEGIQFIYHKPEKRMAPIGEFFIFCLTTALVVVGWRGGVFSKFFRRPPEDNTLATQLVANENHAARATIPSEKMQVFSAPIKGIDSTVHMDSADTLRNMEPTVPSQKQVGKRKPVIKIDSSAAGSFGSTNNIETLVSTNKLTKLTPENVKNVNGTEEVKKPVAKSIALIPEKKDNVKKVDADTSKPIASEHPEKKKTLGQVLKGIFGGKKKKDGN